MRKPSMKVRRQAIEALELAASNFVDGETAYRFSPDFVPGGRSGPVTELMQDAWMEIIGVSPETLAGAACLLRDGWSPGEPTVEIGGGR